MQKNKDLYTDNLDGFIEIVKGIGSNDSKTKVLYVDFLKTEVTVSTPTSKNVKFEDMLATINFCRLAKNTKIISADFLTGAVTISWLGNIFTRLEVIGLTKQEIGFVMSHKRIHAIKTLRSRKPFSLAKAKNIIDKATQLLTDAGEMQ